MCTTGPLAPIGYTQLTGDIWLPDGQKMSVNISVTA